MAVSATSEFQFTVAAESHGQRLDLFLVRQPGLADFSRSALQGLIRDGRVQANGLSPKSGYRVQTGDRIAVVVPPPAPTALVAEEVPFAVLFEDDDLVVLSKPPGIVVHPACGHQAGTLVHGLLFHCDNLSGISGAERPGIVHRLDKDTSGVMVVAKNDLAHRSLIEQFKARSVEKWYHAILDGRLDARSGRVASPIGRHPVHRKKMAVRPQDGREAATNWQVLEEFALPFTYVALRLETGRTHQIRVHMASLGCPVAGDPLYGRSNPVNDQLGIVRQCLHSFSLSFRHPRRDETVRCTAPLWDDMVAILAKLRAVEV